MRSITSGNLKVAIASVKASKWRSLMTMMGIIIGIVSVVTVVSIGEGVKHQVTAVSNHLGQDLITVRPGQIVNRNKNGTIVSINLLAGYASTGTIADDDVVTIRQSQSVKQAVPLSIVSGPITYGKSSSSSAVVIGTTPDLPAILHQRVAYGDFFSSNDSNQNGAIIGTKVARDVFGADVPLGQSFSFHGESFVVRGVFDEFQTAPLALETDFNNAIFIPYQVVQDLTAKKASIYEVLVQAQTAPQADQAAASITARLTAAHGNQQDFTVLKAGETLSLTSNILNLLTRLIAGVAGISLLVGGIGIMNVMLVTVSERTQEIGIRKAIGATSRQIMNQFLVEATVLSFVGGIIGIVISLLINGALRVATSLQPSMSWQVIALASAVSISVGIIFGTAPALKAARKDPIEALRNSQ